MKRIQSRKRFCLGHMWEQFITLNRYSAARFHEEVRAAGFQVITCELTTYPQEVRDLPLKYR